MTLPLPIVSLPTAENLVIDLTDLPLPVAAEALLPAPVSTRYWRPDPLGAEIQLTPAEPEAFGLWLPNVCY